MPSEESEGTGSVGTFQLGLETHPVAIRESKHPIPTNIDRNINAPPQPIGVDESRRARRHSHLAAARIHVSRHEASPLIEVVGLSVPHHEQIMHDDPVISAVLSGTDSAD